MGGRLNLVSTCLHLGIVGLKLLWNLVFGFLESYSGTFSDAAIGLFPRLTCVFTSSGICIKYIHTYMMQRVNEYILLSCILPTSTFDFAFTLLGAATCGANFTLSSAMDQQDVPTYLLASFLLNKV